MSDKSDICFKEEKFLKNSLGRLLLLLIKKDPVQTTATEKNIDTATQMTLEHALAQRSKRSTTQKDSKII